VFGKIDTEAQRTSRPRSASAPFPIMVFREEVVLYAEPAPAPGGMKS